MKKALQLCKIYSDPAHPLRCRGALILSVGSLSFGESMAPLVDALLHAAVKQNDVELIRVMASRGFGETCARKCKELHILALESDEEAWEELSRVISWTPRDFLIMLRIAARDKKKARVFATALERANLSTEQTSELLLELASAWNMTCLREMLPRKGVPQALARHPRVVDCLKRLALSGENGVALAVAQKNFGYLEALRAAGWNPYFVYASVIEKIDCVEMAQWLANGGAPSERLALCAPKLLSAAGRKGLQALLEIGCDPPTLARNAWDALAAKDFHYADAEELARFALAHLPPPSRIVFPLLDKCAKSGYWRIADSVVRSCRLRAPDYAIRLFVRGIRNTNFVLWLREMLLKDGMAIGLTMREKESLVSLLVSVDRQMMSPPLLAAGGRFLIMVGCQQMLRSWSYYGSFDVQHRFLVGGAFELVLGKNPRIKLVLMKLRSVMMTKILILIMAGRRRGRGSVRLPPELWEWLYDHFAVIE